eukprot:SAG11_NODE_8652_length_991_cov_0.828475_1_plen_135_part_00
MANATPFSEWRAPPRPFLPAACCPQRTDPKWRDKAEAGMALETRLRAAVRRGDKATVAKLLDQITAAGSTEIDGTDEHGRTAFFLACMEGHLLVAMSLLRAGADPTRRDDNGATPFVAACAEVRCGMSLKDSRF